MEFPDWYTPFVGAVNLLIDRLIVDYGDQAERAPTKKHPSARSKQLARALLFRAYRTLCAPR
jgi:hypothetical protein